MDRETIIKGCEDWVNNHTGENFLLTYSSVVELLAVLKEQERLIVEVRNEGYNEGYNEAYHSYCVEVAEEDQELRRILPYSVVQCEDCENAGPAYFTDEGEMLYDCNKTECCKRRSVK